jgi:hypothetical protein
MELSKIIATATWAGFSIRPRRFGKPAHEHNEMLSDMGVAEVSAATV